MAITANELIQAQNPGNRRKIPVAASTALYQGQIVFYERTSGTAEGYATGACDSGTNDFAGIAVAAVDNSSGSAGDLYVEVFTVGGFVLQGTGFIQGIVGDLAYASDNFTITASSSSTTKIGAFSEYISTTKMRVDIDTIQT